MNSPLRTVLRALEDGAPTLHAVRARTGLDETVVGAAIDLLVRTGHVGAERIMLGCSGDCGGCPAASGGGSRCGSTGTGTPTAAGPTQTGCDAVRTPRPERGALTLWVVGR
ncbi:MAG: hypothetical protein HKP61_18020 [Dactylosporangium sp.]|nr:hypothetical protein [Dactylosporangium sp.]NNJ62795.1 hypothetical protein [Dactylosporangium sp.]